MDKFLFLTFILLTMICGYIAKCKTIYYDDNILPGKMSRIINGEPANNDEVKFMVAIFIFKNDTYVSFCGGTLISSKAVLTATHCVYDYDTKTYVFLLI